MFFTVIVEYRGGTYIDQVHADEPGLALAAWLQKQVEDDLRLWHVGRADLSTMLPESTVVPLGRLQNVWCVSLLLAAHLMLVNIVRTRKTTDFAQRGVLRLKIPHSTRW